MLLFQCYREFAFLCCSGSIHPSIVFSALLSLSFWIFKLRNGGKKKGGEMAGRGNSTTLFFTPLYLSREIALPPTADRHRHIIPTAATPTHTPHHKKKQNQNQGRRLEQ